MSKTPVAAEKSTAKRSPLQAVLDGVEVVGDKVPHPAIIFVVLIGIVMVLSQIFAWTGASVTYENANIVTDEIETITVSVRSLLDADGIRFIFTSAVDNFNSFGVVGVILVAMLGVGLAEEVGLISAMIRRLVILTHPRLITFMVVFLGVLSSVATDAGYLVLIPLGAAIFHSLGRHPLAGLAAAFGGVAAGFGVNILITPFDGMVTEVTNEALSTVTPQTMDVTANLFFAIVSTFFVAIVCTVITDKFVEPRLGAYEGAPPEHTDALDDAEKRGLKFAFRAMLASAVVLLVLTLPPGAPLEDAFLSAIIFIVMAVFLVTGIAYGVGAGTITTSTDIINPIVKTFAGLAGLIFLLLIISQFIAYFNYSNLATVGAVNMADALEESNVSSFWLLLGFIAIVLLVDVVMPGGLPAWAILAPIFVPLFWNLGVGPDVVLAAYRVGDSPMNALTPLMPYFALIVTFAQKYRPKAGVGTVVSLMLPYSTVLIVTWTALFLAWFGLGLPFGPGDIPHP